MVHLTLSKRVRDFSEQKDFRGFLIDFSLKQKDFWWRCTSSLGSEMTLGLLFVPQKFSFRSSYTYSRVPDKRGKGGGFENNRGS